MDTAALLQIILSTALTACAIWLAVWLSRRPNRAKDATGRVRMPRFVAVCGWLLLAVGVLMCLVAFGSPPDDDATAMRIAAVAIAVGGLAFLALYRNFYVIAGPDAVVFRNVWGIERGFAYSDIDGYEMLEQNGRRILHVHAATGVSLRADPRMFALEPLLAAIAFYESTGRWPLPGEPRPPIAPPY